MPNKTLKEVPLTAELHNEYERLSSNPDLHPTSEDWKRLGNKCFQNESFLTAIKCYTCAINMNECDEAVIRSNRSAAYLKSSMFAGPSLALKDAERTVELDPHWYKAHLRVGDAQYARNKLEEARTAYEKALALCPTCTTAQNALHTLKTDIFLQKLNAEEHKKQLEEANVKEDQHVEHFSGQNSTSSNTNGNATSLTNSTNCDQSHGYDNVMCEEATRERYEFHNAPLDCEVDNVQKGRLPTEAETTTLVQEWKEDTCVRDGHTAFKPRLASLEEANRVAGKAYKEQLLSKFRHKLTSNETFKESVHDKLEKEKLAGEDVDYRRAEEYRKQFSHSTNGIGLAISADAYKDYIGKDKKW